MSDSGKVLADPIFVGLTRPTMMLAVGQMWVIMSFFVCMIGFILTSNPKFLLLYFIFHGIGFFLYSKDPYILELLMAKMQKCANNRINQLLHHGANTYDQF